MSRVVAFGCSLTFGTALKDCWINNTSGPEPSKYAWPQVLADKMGLECVNLSRPGASNKEIHHKIMTTEFNHDDIVVVLWTYNNRWSVINNKYVISFLPRNVTMPLTDLPWICTELDIRKQKMAEVFYKYLHNDCDMNIDFSYRLDHANLHLRSLNIKNYQFMTDRIPALKDNATYIRNRIRRPFMSDIRVTDSRGLDGVHPDEHIHEQYAELVYKEITKK